MTKRITTYQEALAWIEKRLRFGIKPGLDRMYWLLSALDNPQNKLRAVHVVGTNGKGSTVNYLEHILRESGYTVGTFTSPYIMDFRERITHDGQMIAQADLVYLAERLAPLTERLTQETPYGDATEFEVLTVMMFLYFAEIKPVDMAIVEAGLGGLLDSTNVFTPLAVLCPSIGRDHQNILGNSYTEIAEQKAGVLTEGCPFVFATDISEVKQVFYRLAAKKHCPVYHHQKDFVTQGTTERFLFTDGKNQLSDLSLTMLGHHQIANAALAIKTALLLQADYPQITALAIKKGIKKAKWQGRIEQLSSNLLIDGAHNDESIAALIATLKTNYPNKSYHFLFAAIDTKPVASMLDQLEAAGQVTVTSFSYPNALELATYPDRYQKVPHFKEWLARSYDDKTANHLYVVTGSLYFIAQVRQHLS